MKLSRRKLIEIKETFARLMDIETGNAAAAYFVAENYRLISDAIGPHYWGRFSSYEVPKEYQKFQEAEKEVYRKFKCNHEWRYLNTEIMNHCTEYGTIPVLKSDGKKLDKALDKVKAKYKDVLDIAEKNRRQVAEKEHAYYNEEFEIEFVQIKLRDLPGMLPKDMSNILFLIKGKTA